MRDPHAPHDTRDALRSLLRTVSHLSMFYTVAPGRLALMLLCTGLAAGLSLAVPWLLKGVLDAGLAQRQMRQVYLAGAILVATTAVRAAAAYGQSYLAAYLAQHLAYRLRHQAYAQIQRLSCAEHDRTRTGELMSRVTSDIEAIREFFHFGVPIGLSLVLTGVETLLALAWLAWPLAALVLVSVPLFLGGMAGLSYALRPLHARVQERSAALAIIIQESLAGIRVVKTFARERQQTQTFTAMATALAQARLQVVSKEALPVTASPARPDHGSDALARGAAGGRRHHEPGNAGGCHRVSGPTGAAVAPSDLAHRRGVALPGRGRAPLRGAGYGPGRAGRSTGTPPTIAARPGAL